MNKVCFFTLVSDLTRGYFTMMHNSLMKFHPDIPHIEKPFLPELNYKIYAHYGKELAKEYELVIAVDADSIITGDLSHIINDDSYDIGGVMNNNLIDPKLQMWDTPPHSYINCGLVAIRGERIWNWWDMLNNSYHSQFYRFREQDMLNIIFHYGDVKTKIFDRSDKWHGLVHKGQWSKFVMRGNDIVLPKTEGVCDEDKKICAIHWAGGNSIPKMNYWTVFPEDVAKRLDYLVKEAK